MVKVIPPQHFEQQVYDFQILEIFDLVLSLLKWSCGVDLSVFSVIFRFLPLRFIFDYANEKVSYPNLASKASLSSTRPSPFKSANDLPLSNLYQFSLDWPSIPTITILQTRHCFSPYHVWAYLVFWWLNFWWRCLCLLIFAFFLHKCHRHLLLSSC